MVPLSQPKVIDTHIHLWPSTAVSSTDHAWMAAGHQLAKRHGIVDYDAATSSSNVRPVRFVYVETDRYLPSTDPEDVAWNDAEEETVRKLKVWAKAPLEELDFLRRMVDGEPRDGDGFSPDDGKSLVGLVIWAPFHLPPDLFNLYLKIAEQTLGSEAWDRVVGFRYLIQGRSEDDVKKLVLSDAWLHNLVTIGQGRVGKGWAFDIGVDCHRDGIESLGIVAEMVERARVMESGRQGTRFILNHLCKPDLSSSPWPSLPTYIRLLSRLAADPNVYMKLSGALNEFAPLPTPSSVPDVLASLRPFLDPVFALFGSARVMFGSDWPVCNVGGPKGEAGNWALWREVVEGWMGEGRFGEENRRDVWCGTAVRAYGLEGEA